jgi:NAD+ synthase
VRELLARSLNRRGLVVAISGGIDSAVCAALAVQAVGPERVFGLLLPERDSSPDSTRRGRLVAERFAIPHAVFDIAPALQAMGCYEWRDAAIKNLFPDYAQEWKSKIVIAGGHEGAFYYFKLVVQRPDGTILENRIDKTNYLQIVAATNFKQRVRKTIEYFHADRLHYAVVGTPNRLEYDQGFFVKSGDGAADIKPIAHLYKTQVYALARHLGVPAEICNAAPTTDTYSMVQGQDEFYFALPYAQMDIALALHNAGEPPEALASAVGIDVALARFIYKDIDTKRRTTGPLHWQALLVEPVNGPITSPRITPAAQG